MPDDEQVALRRFIHVDLEEPQALFHLGKGENGAHVHHAQVVLPFAQAAAIAIGGQKRRVYEKERADRGLRILLENGFDQPRFGRPLADVDKEKTVHPGFNYDVGLVIAGGERHLRCGAGEFDVLDPRNRVLICSATEAGTVRPSV